MAAKSNRTRASARAKRAAALGISQERIDKERQLHSQRELMLDAEQKAFLDEMRALKFAPPKGIPSQKQFARYAAYRRAVAASRAAALADNELAIAQIEGGLMSRIFERLNNPALKDTAFANLAAVASRAITSASAKFDDEDDGTGASLPESERVAAIMKKLGVAK